jgi:hypothetical protein
VRKFNSNIIKGEAIHIVPPFSLPCQPVQAPLQTVSAHYSGRNPEVFPHGKRNFRTCSRFYQQDLLLLQSRAAEI